MGKTNSKQHPLPMDQDRGKPWKQIFDNIEDLSFRFIWCLSKWHQEKSLGYVVFICSINDYLAIYTTAFTLQLCYEPLWIPQRVTKSQKVHISSHDGLQNILTSVLLNIGPRVSQSGDRVAGIRPSLIKY